MRRKVGRVNITSFGLLALLSLPQEALAVGALFGQDGRGALMKQVHVLLAYDEARNQTRIIIDLQYTGQTQDFLWLLPVPSEPVLLGHAPMRLFDKLDPQVAPRFTVAVETDGICVDPQDFVWNGDIPPVEPLVPEPPEPDRNVPFPGSDLPYETHVLSSTVGLQEWIQSRGYDVPEEVPDLWAPYVERGDTFVALRFDKPHAPHLDGRIPPLDLTFDGLVTELPLRMSEMSDAWNMEFVVTVLSDSARAIPQNYRHVVLNLAKIDWWTGGRNEPEVVKTAVEEAGGQAFTTRAAVSSRLLDDTVHVSLTADSIAELRNLPPILRTLDSADLLQHADVARILSNHIEDRYLERVERDAFERCPACAGFRVSPDLGYLAEPLAEALETRILNPSRQIQTFVDGFQYLTQMAMPVSFDGISEDPRFSFRSDLPDYDHVHPAVAHIECGLGGSRQRVPARLTILETGQVLFFADVSTPDRDILDQMPSAHRIEMLETGRVIEDLTQQIEDRIAEHNAVHQEGCGCTSSSAGLPPTPAGAGLLFLALLVGLRKRRRKFLNLAVGLFAIGTTGCMSTNTFDNARALAPGTLSHSIGISGYVITNDDVDRIPAPIAMYGFRWGAFEGFELGAQANLAGNFRLSLKINPLRTEHIDLALAPSGFVQYYPGKDATHTQGGNFMAGFDLPLLVNFRFGESFMLIPSIGPGYAAHLSSGGHAWFARGGLGVRMQVTQRLYLQPEGTTVYDPTRQTPVDYSFGLALGFVP